MFIKNIFYKPLNTASSQAKAEINDLKKEFDYLFSDARFDKSGLALRKATYAVGKARKALRKVQAKYSACISSVRREGVSFAKIASENCVPDIGAKSEQPFLDWVEESKADFKSAQREERVTRAYFASLARKIGSRFEKRQAQEAKIFHQASIEKLRRDRISFRKLALAIAKRYTVVRTKVVDRPALIKKIREKGIREFKELSSKYYYPDMRVEPWETREHYAQLHPVQEAVKPKSKVWNSGKTIKNKRKIVFETEKSVLNQKQEARKKSLSSLCAEKIGYLKLRLKFKLYRFRKQHILERFVLDATRDWPMPQMETEGEMVESLTSDLKSNVVIATSSEVVKGIPPTENRGFGQYAISKEIQTFNTLTERWLKLSTISWVKSDAPNKAMATYDFPKVLLQDFQNTQMTQLLFTNRLFRMGLHFKFILNSSPWLNGMLVADWRYTNESDDTSPIANVYSALQRNHVKLIAGSSNNAELIVPFNHVSSYLSNRETHDTFGRLTIQPLVALSGTDAVAIQAQVTIMVALIDFEGHGLISRDLGAAAYKKKKVQGQMNEIGSLCNIGSNVLRTAGNMFNQDKPPLPLQPVSLVPQSVPSFAYTDGIIEPINVLRSDPRGQRPPALNGGEMSLSYVSRQWGLLSQFPWRFSDTNPDQPIYQTKLQPLLSVDNYVSKKEVTTGISTAIYPPVAYVASLASRCRGNLEYKFEVVANSFYTGSLQISVIPLDSNSYRTATQANMSSTFIMDIVKQPVFIVSAPWNFYDAWMATPNLFNTSGENFGTLSVRILNPLVAINNVPATIYINVYVRAGENFEVALLRTPQLSLFRAPIIPSNQMVLKPYNVENKIYCTSSSDMRSYDKTFRVPYIQNVVHGWVGFTNLLEGQIYKLNNRTSIGYYFRLYGDQAKTTQIAYACAHPDLATSNAKGIVVFSSLAAAQGYIKTVVAAKYTAAAVATFFKSFPAEYYGADGPWSEISNNNIDWRQADNEQDDYPLWYESSKRLDSDFELIEVVNARGQMEEQGYTVTTEELAPSTSYGLRVYGESMPDMKGIGRRWQIFNTFSGKTSMERISRDAPPFCKLVVAPQRLVTPIISHDYDNRVRDGSIALINSTYAYWEGGMRYRFVITSDLPDDAIIYVQHRFDSLETSMRPEIPSNTQSARDMMDTHYPVFAQSLKINPIITVEVPYTQRYERLFCREVSPFANGSIYVWIHSPKVADIDVDVYYSLADDFQWSLFQGCPTMLDISQFPAEKPQGQMDDRPRLQRYFNSDDEDEDDEPSFGTQPQGLFDRMSSGISYAAESGCQRVAEHLADHVDDRLSKMLKNGDEMLMKINDAAGAIKDNTSLVTESICSLTKKAEDFVTSISGLPTALSDQQRQRIKERGTFELFTDLGTSAFDYITHLVYCAFSPKASTISWAIVNLYRTIWGFSGDGIYNLISPISNLWAKAQQSIQQPQAAGQMEDTDIASLGSLLFTTMSSSLKLLIKPPKSWSDLSQGLFDFSQHVRGGNLIRAFIKDNVTFLKRVWNKILSIFHMGSKNYRLIAGIEDNRLKQWCIYSSAMLNPSVYETILTQPLWAEKAFELAITGRAILISVVGDKSIPPSIMKIINDNVEGLKKLEQELVNRNVFCGERYEPFCLWAHGPAGSGKTRLLQDVATKLADDMGSTSPQTYHTITINQQYFDGYVGQPSIFIDDFLAVSPATDPTAAMFIQMKSSALFNPPYSDVKDKCRLVNFQNLLITSNFASVNNIAGIHDNSAYNRRRDLVIQVDPISLPKDKDSWTLDDYKELNHIKVSYANKPIDPTHGDYVELERVDGKPYRDVVFEFIMARAKSYHQKESESFGRRCQEKITRMNTLTGVDSVESYLQKATDILLKSQENLSWDPSKLFSHWAWKAKTVCDDFYTMETRKKVMEKTLAEEPELRRPNPVLKMVKATNFAVARGKKKEPESMSRSELEILAEESGAQINKVIPVTVEENGYESSEGEPQGDTTGEEADKPQLIWPAVSGNPLSSGENIQLTRHGKLVIEPLERPPEWGVLQDEKICLHSLITDFTPYVFDSEVGCFVYTMGQAQDPTKIPYSFSVDFCRHGEEGRVLPTCYLHDSDFRNTVYTSLVDTFLDNNPDVKTKFPLFSHDDFDEICEDFPRLIMAYVCAKVRMFEDVKNLLTKNMRLEKIIENYQKQLARGHVAVGNYILPKEPKWKSIPKTIWRYFLNFCSLMERVFSAIFRVVFFFGSIVCLFSMGSAIKDAWCESGTPQLHPSGDFKTIRQVGTMRQSAMKLVKPSGQHISDGELIEYCKTPMEDPSTDGRLRKIVKNVFTLVGYAGYQDREIVYRARCIGLCKYKFLVLRHYIEHFKHVGVTKVAIVHHKGVGVQHFLFEDLEFEWSESGGYGVGKFPTLARPFCTITKFMPSERFDGNYPTTLKLIEVGGDDISIIDIHADRMLKDKFIPENNGQSAWTIKKGFTYKWGGPGKCGTFLFAPQMSCPLIGVHTAGIGTQVGYAELLLKETFEDSTEIQLDFVEPQMNISDSADVPGEAYIVGSLPADKCVNLPTSTKIVPSEIAGVFPITTEPAPLRRFDPRVDHDCDPFEEGIKKRCEPPRELPSDCLIAAGKDLTDTLLLSVKPLRTIVPLTVKEAVEGLELEGYDPMEIKTSEGYPWILQRPKTATDKSWLFKFDNYEDGRRKLIGIDRKLQDHLDLKMEMRKRFIVPATYYTACLKDARILKSKINVPGKTRVFEMSPVDLTIAQRQYFLDFYAAYQKARLQAENSIGINPEGPEWTALVDKLTSFSPHILTADYSGYGPKLLMSVQEISYLCQLYWYQDNETRYGLTEQEIDDRFNIRYSMLYEMLHPLTVLKDIVVKFNTGMPSGNAGTVIINSLCNSLYIRVMYLILARKYRPEYADMYWFHTFVCMVSNGDDLIMAVKPDIIDWFNNATLIEGFAKYEIKMTDALKSDGLVRPYCTIEEATFLKRGFKKHPTRVGEWMAPLEKASITDTANWVFKSVDLRAASLVNSEMACRLAYSQGPEFYDSVVEAISGKWREKGVRFLAPSWKSLDLHVWEGTEGPRFICKV